MAIGVALIKTEKKQIELVQIYREYRCILESSTWSGNTMDYHWSTLTGTLGSSWLPYREMLNEYSVDIANAINQLTDYTNRLKVWDAVTAGIPSDEVFEITREFVDPISTTVLTLPYAIRSRFIFATAHLAHQANQLLDGTSWVDDLPPDSDIYFGTADKYAGRWATYRRLKICLEQISATGFREGTKDYRNKFNHQFPPGIALGLTGMVSRTPDGRGRASYSIGATKPLSIAKIVRLSEHQCNSCYEAFNAFKAFVHEQEAKILDSGSSL